jgi:hypothetical protein
MFSWRRIAVRSNFKLYTSEFVYEYGILSYVNDLVSTCTYVANLKILILVGNEQLQLKL